MITHLVDGKDAPNYHLVFGRDETGHHQTGAIAQHQIIVNIQGLEREMLK